MLRSTIDVQRHKAIRKQAVRLQHHLHACLNSHLWLSHYMSSFCVLTRFHAQILDSLMPYSFDTFGDARTSSRSANPALAQGPSRICYIAWTTESSLQPLPYWGKSQAGLAMSSFDAREGQSLTAHTPFSSSSTQAAWPRFVSSSGHRPSQELGCPSRPSTTTSKRGGVYTDHDIHDIHPSFPFRSRKRPQLPACRGIQNLHEEQHLWGLQILLVF